MSSPRFLTIRMELAGVEPEVWRRLRLRDSLTLEHVHLALRAVMGWDEGGEYEFEALGQTYHGSDDGDRELAASDARHPSCFTLSDFGPRPGEAWDYRFDDGELRRHTLTVEEMTRTDGDVRDVPPAVCLEATGPHPADGGGTAGPPSAKELTRELEAWVGSTVTASPSLAGPTSPTGISEPGQPAGGRAGDTVDLEVEPEADEALKEVFRRLDAKTGGGADLPPPVRSATEELLIIQAEFDPDPMVQANKPEVWAAGAIHAAHMELRRGRGSPEWTLEGLAERFDVSPGSVSRRSTRIRELAAEHYFVPGPVDEEQVKSLVAALRDSSPDSTDESPGPADDPAREIERLYLIGEESGRRSPFGRAADLLEEHGDELDRETLEYLLRRGLENADGTAERQLLHLAVRHFGTDVATWAPEGARRWL